MKKNEKKIVNRKTASPTVTEILFVTCKSPQFAAGMLGITFELRLIQK